MSTYPKNLLLLFILWATYPTLCINYIGDGDVIFNGKKEDKNLLMLTGVLVTGSEHARPSVWLRRCLGGGKL